MQQRVLYLKKPNKLYQESLPNLDTFLTLPEVRWDSKKKHSGTKTCIRMWCMHVDSSSNYHGGELAPIEEDEDEDMDGHTEQKQTEPQAAHRLPWYLPTTYQPCVVCSTVHA